MRHLTVFVVALIFFSVAALAAISNAYAGQTTRVSASPAGLPANASASSGVISGDGRYVVFESSASNLVTEADGTPVSGTHVYRRDRNTGTTELVSRATTGRASAGISRFPTVSEDGNYVAFASFAIDLVAGAPNFWMDVFRRDMAAGTTTLVSENVAHEAGNAGSALSGFSGAREISNDGRYVVFTSSATNLVAEGNNAVQQVYVKDMTGGSVVRASVNNAGVTGTSSSQQPTISGNGTVVAFQSASTNFEANTPQIYTRVLPAGPTTLESVGAVAPGRTSSAPTLSNNGTYLAFESAAALNPRDLDNGTIDVFLRDRDLGTTVLASLSDNALDGAMSQGASISGDGRWVGFWSRDDQLIGVTSDTNGFDDIFVYDRVDKTVKLVSLNDAGDQTNGTSGGTLGGPSVSADGNVVLFGSLATNLVASATNSFNQLYVRILVASNTAPTVILPSSQDLAFTRTLDVSGSFTDPDANETYSATVNYGDGTGTQSLALVGHTFALQHTYLTVDTYTVSVTVSDGRGGSTTATMLVKVSGYTYEWLDPIADMFVVGRNLPVKFTVRGPDGALVLDQSVVVDVVDASGNVVAGPYVFGDQPSRSVTWGNGMYHVNVDTRDLAPGMYWLRVTFSSPALAGEFTLATNGTAAAGTTATTQKARVR
jgi:Tol biopolymer transport system component